MRPRRRRPSWAWQWPHIRWVREELREGRWVEMQIDPAVEQAYHDARKILDGSGTTAEKQEAFDAVIKFHAETLARLDPPPEV